jgi:hypothetical protein
MSSQSNEILLHLLRNRGELAAELLSLSGEPALCADELSAEASSVDLDRLAPPEYRPDHVILFRDRQHHPVYIVVVVILQHLPGSDDRLYWPLYIAAARLQHQCPCALLIVTPSASVAQQARQPIEIGPRNFCLRPLAISYSDVPTSVDPSLARRVPELAVLSALAHPSLQTLQQAAAVMHKLPPERAQLYVDAIVMALDSADQKPWRPRPSKDGPATGSR